MRVLFLITTTDFGGTESILLELVRRLPAQGIEPIVCSLCTGGRIAGEITSSGRRVLSLGMSAQPTPIEMGMGAWQVARLIDAERIDVVQTLLYRANVVGALAARLSRRKPPVVSSQRSLDNAGTSGARVSALLVKWTRRFARLTVAVSEAVRREVVATERLAPESVLVIPNGVDTTRFAPSTTQPDRAAFGFDGGVVVGGAGRLSRVKGFDLLIEAAAIARREGADLRVVLAGEGPERQAVQQLAVSLGIAEHVRFLGARRGLESFYGAIDIFALPSRQEGSPNAVLEAMACGRATVAAAVGGVPELIKDGVCGLLAPAGDTRAFATALLRLANDAALRDRLGRAARQHTVDLFDILHTVARHAEVYRTVAGNGRAAAIAARPSPARTPSTAGVEAR